ncbi:hypothetical protein [Arvimicrobium flavum]|uniref:hypothetical protein n=1 Tax=Arvimicrobium flavum TaxID=3393320 RepID=UPI00237BF24B|nr:hypothetical protein [Mesorhizobium shangrilense]
MAALLLRVGVSTHGLSFEVQQRLWDDILGRLHGPMTSRLFLQPGLAFLVALFKEYPPAQHTGSFTVEDVHASISSAASGANQ